MDELDERLELAAGRLRELQAECPEPFFAAAAGLSLGFPESEKWLDFSVCRELPEAGVYLCILYAQIWQLYLAGLCDEKNARAAGNTELELLCVTRELLLLVYGQYESGEKAEAIRDSLYWFYLDYAGLTLAYAEKLAEEGASFGGAMLAVSGDFFSSVHGREHTWDCGLFLGSRYVTRILQESRRPGKQPGRLLSLLLLADPDRSCPGSYALTEHQKEAFYRLRDELSKG